MIVRPARETDIASMKALIDRYAAEDRMLERSDAFLRANLADFLVADADGAFLGCGALAALTGDLAEVRSLAVMRDAGGRGVGKADVEACVERARERRTR